MKIEHFYSGFVSVAGVGTDWAAWWGSERCVCVLDKGECDALCVSDM